MDPFKPYEPRQRAAAPPKLTDQDAETIALKAIGFIAGDEDLLPRFVDLTGCGADELRARLSDRGFLAAVLDFILGDEATTLRFAECEGFAPETPMLARSRLS
jgi:hypothetical protein